jgi:hypothetical protein
VVAIKYVSDATSGFPGTTPDPAHNNANATVMAVFSERAFTIANTDPLFTELSNSFNGSIVRGLNLRNDYTASFVAQSDNAVSAQSANALFTGDIIPAADFIHVGRGYVPNTTSTSALGSSTNRFSHLFTDTISVGNPVTPQTVNVVGTLTVGNATSNINQLFVKDVTVGGNIGFVSGVQDVGSSAIPISNLFATNVSFTRGTISTTPSANTDIVNKLYVDTVASTPSAVATTVTLVPTTTTSAVHFPVFVDSATGNENPRTDTDLQYNPGTNTLTAGVFSGSGASLTALNASNISTGTVAIANGGTGGTTAQAARNNLAAAVTSGQYLRGNGTNVLMSAIQAGDVPTLNQNTTGSAATLTTARTIGGVSFNGSTNINLPGVNTTGNQNTTGSAATLTTARTIGGVSFNGSTNINLPGVNTAGNQNTTGTAAGLSATLAVASGGTGQTTYTNGQLLIGNSTGNTLAKATLTAGTGISITNGTGSITIAATGGGGSGEVTFADRTTDESGHAVFIGTTATGTQSMFTNTNYRFNPSTAELSATNFNSTSDINKKHNIETIEGALDIVKKLRGVRFNWNHNDQPGIGVVAQEIEQYVPEVVVALEDNKTVQYGNLIGLLIEAIKEQQKQIDELKK